MTIRTSLSALALILSVGAAPAFADVTYNGSVTGSNGGSVSVEGGASYDPATGRSRDATVTTGNGNTYNRSTTANCSGGNGSANCTKSSTVSGANNSATRSVDRSASDGTGAKTVTRQGPAGNTATRQRWITVNP